MRAIIALLGTACVLALTSCATPRTKVIAAWKDPQVDVISVNKSLLVFQHESEPMRRVIEDAIAARIPGAVPAYTMFDTEQVFDEKLVRERVKQGGLDNVIIMRLVDVDEEVNWSPGAPYDPLWGYWGYGWSTVYHPGYLYRTTIVTLETLVYSLDIGDGELIWASRSETFDPNSIEDLAASVVRASTRQMEKEGIFVAKEPITEDVRIQ